MADSIHPHTMDGREGLSFNRRNVNSSQYVTVPKAPVNLFLMRDFTKDTLCGILN